MSGKVRVIDGSNSDEGEPCDDPRKIKIPWITLEAKVTEQPKALVPLGPYTRSKELGHSAPRPFEHGVCCGCNDRPRCHTNCLMATFCPCFLLARLSVMDGLAREPHSYWAQLVFTIPPFVLAFVGYFSAIMLVPLLMMGKAQPPPPPPSPVDPWYYVRFPAYAAAPAHVLGSLIVALTRRRYRARHRITAVADNCMGGVSAAESMTDEDELWKCPCLFPFASCDNASCSLLCGCCLMIQMADE